MENKTLESGLVSGSNNHLQKGPNSISFCTIRSAKELIRRRSAAGISFGLAEYLDKRTPDRNNYRQPRRFP